MKDLVNNEVLVETVDAVEADYDANIEAVTETEPVTEETTDVAHSGRYPWGDDPEFLASAIMKKLAIAGLTGAAGVIGAEVAKKVLIPGAKKAYHAGVNLVKVMWSKRKEKKAAKAQEDTKDETEE